MKSKSIVKRLFIFALFCLLAVFVIYNSAKVAVWFFIGTVEMPIAFVVLFSALLGFGLAYGVIYLRKK